MNEDMIALGRRAVACKGWRWMDGMTVFTPGATSDGGDDANKLPYLYDPTTRFCLRELVREARGEASGVPKNVREVVETVTSATAWAEMFPAMDEIESLVAALEAAP